jgi:hypothetical protein
MQKPTTTLNFQIIEFVMRQSQITNLLSQRDNHDSTIGMELSCRFYKRHQTDSN